MAEFWKRALAPRGLGMAFTAVVAMFCLGSDNALMWMMDAQGVRAPFAWALCLGAAAAFAAAAARPAASTRGQALRTVAAMAASILGLVAAGLVGTLPQAACAVASGALLGVGLAMMMRQWWATLTPLRADALLCTTCLALLLASILWLVTRQTGDFYTTCLCLVVCALCGGLLRLMFLLVDVRGEVMGPQPPQEAPEGWLGMPWVRAAAAAGLWIDFLTLGLSFTPTSVEATAPGLLVTPAAYLLAALALSLPLCLSRAARRDFTNLCVVALAVAGAIMLVTPFADALVQAVPALQVVSCAGMALFLMMGVALTLCDAHDDPARACRRMSCVALGCLAAFGLGVAVYQLLGTSGQVVSLCLLTVYLVGLVVATLRGRAAEPDDEPEAATEPEAADSRPQAACDPRQGACEALAERYRLSPREAEVMGYLARGYGASYVAKQLFISADTARTHCKRIYEKVGVHTREELLEVIEGLE